MKGLFKKFSRSVGLTAKMVILTIGVGLLVWAALDFFLNRTVRNIFQQQLAGRLEREATEDRLRFDRYLDAHHQLARLLAAQKVFRDHLDEVRWFQSQDGEVQVHSRPPKWFPPSSILRSLASPRFTVLLDGEGRTREAYYRTGKPPDTLTRPEDNTITFSLGQAFISTIDGLPYVTSAEKITGPGGERSTLLLASPIDDIFLGISLGDFPDRLIALVSPEGKIIVSNRADLLPSGASLDSLRGRYLITSRRFQDYGGSEIAITFTTFVETSEVEKLTGDVLGRARRHRAVMALAFILASIFSMVYITKRVDRLNRLVGRFSRDTLGAGELSAKGGDQIDLLEERFHQLTGAFKTSQERIQASAEERARRTIELARKEHLSQLLQSVTDAVGIGVLFRGEEGLLPANHKMTHYLGRFGGPEKFDIEGLDTEERKLDDVDGNNSVFELTPLTFGSGDRVILARDVTESRKSESALRASEKRFRSLFEDSLDPIYMSGRDGTVVQANQAFIDLFGFGRDELIGGNILRLYADPTDRINFVNTIEKKGSVREYALRMRRKDGSEVDCHITSTLWFDDEGTVLGYQGIVRDVTEKSKIEKELMRIEKLESVGILAGGIAHDFNNILQAILTNINIAMMLSQSEKKVLERLVEAEHATMEAKDLTSQLLTFARGGTPLRRATPVSALIRESVNFALRGSGITASIYIDKDLWEANVDEGQLVQVINNLVINAQQAMEGGGEVRVGVGNAVLDGSEGLPLGKGNYLKLSIRDQGEGIPEADLPKIFDPFYTTKKRGSGLGLAVVHSIVKNHDGYITVDDSSKEGTTFVVYLPASEVEAAEKEQVSPVTGGGKVLVMDDEKMVRESIRDTLIQLGYTVVLAREGLEALRLYQEAQDVQSPFDAVIMDLTVPGGMSGKEAVTKLLEVDPGAKAIVSSGYFNNPVMSNYREHGFRGILAKPYTASDLKRVLNKVMAES